MPRTAKNLLAAMLLPAALLAWCRPSPAQTPSPSVQQSPRQAVIEMITGGAEGYKRHLTIEARQKISTSSADSSMTANPFAFVDTLKGDGIDIQSSSFGSTLLTLENSKQHKKVEVHVDSEEARGNSHQMDLSFVFFDNGKEQDAAVEARVALGLVLQEDIWRLNTITATIKVPVGDPRLYDSTFWNAAENTDNPNGGTSAAGTIAASWLGVNSSVLLPNAPKQKMPVARAIRLIGLAESIYQQRNPRTGYTCRLSDLINIGKGFGIGESEESTYSFIDPELASGQYNGYHFALSGCQGSPVAAFAVTAEPLSGNGRAYCSDATHNLRASDDGRGATCILFGKPTIN